MSESRVNSFNEVIDVVLQRRLYLIAGCLEVFQQFQLRYLSARMFHGHYLTVEDAIPGSVLKRFHHKREDYQNCSVLYCKVM